MSADFAVRPRLLALAVATSLGTHAGLLGLLLLGHAGVGGEGGSGLDTRVEEVGGISLWLDDAPRTSAAKATAVVEESGSAVLPVTVQEPAPLPALPVAAPRLQPAPGGGGMASGAAVGAGTAGAGSGVVPASFLGVPVRESRIVYVVDRSVSMGLTGALGIAKEALTTSLRQLPAEARFQVILYNRTAEPLRLDGRTDLLPATAEFRERALVAVTAARAEGGTGHAAALRRALGLRPDVILFVTDADDLALDEVRALTRANTGRVVIHALQVGAERGRGDGPLAQLAQANRGTYRYVAAVR